MEQVKTVFDDLIGKRIDAVLMDDEKFKLSFKIGDVFVDYYAAGDCCSSSWFQNFSGIEALLGQVVNEVREIESETLDDGDKRKGAETDCEQVYGFVFTTNRGRADLDMRNDSNGYYGGSVERVGERSWRIQAKDWVRGEVEVKEDF
jgi:Fe-S cluster biogenesis protein NfuA